jgi:hypothetical protein
MKQRKKGEKKLKKKRIWDWDEKQEGNSKKEGAGRWSSSFSIRFNVVKGARGNPTPWQVYRMVSWEGADSVAILQLVDSHLLKDLPSVSLHL